MSEAASIHPTAIVSAKAEVGRGVSVGPYSIIGDGVILHDGVRVTSHCVIEGPSEFGSGTVFFPFVSAGQAPHDLKYKGEPSRLVVGQRNVFREFTTIHRGTEGGGNLTSIGSDNLFMAQAHVAHDCHIGNHVIFANAASLAGHVFVEDFATLGAFSGVHQFCRVGKYAFIGASSVVVKDALPYARSAGNHARCYGPNTIGLKRQGFSNEVIRRIDHAFHLLLAAKLNTTQATERIKAELSGHAEIDYLIQFIEASERGVTK
ncbi:MAG TPA: acyl-ACP--UDP-N-acetylglucosamine O-acyltransferase [Blastocatellia bacterium]|nr:acyl-ACP--UDP-N-acetylglucosamine O-acyltransferase [Blastocatellia bacterium]